MKIRDENYRERLTQIRQKYGYAHHIPNKNQQANLTQTTKNQPTIRHTLFARRDTTSVDLCLSKKQPEYSYEQHRRTQETQPSYKPILNKNLTIEIADEQPSFGTHFQMSQFQNSANKPEKYVYPHPNIQSFNKQVNYNQYNQEKLPRPFQMSSNKHALQESNRINREISLKPSKKEEKYDVFWEYRNKIRNQYFKENKTERHQQKVGHYQPQKVGHYQPQRVGHYQPERQYEGQCNELRQKNNKNEREPEPQTLQILQIQSKLSTDMNNYTPCRSRKVSTSNQNNPTRHMNIYQKIERSSPYKALMSAASNRQTKLNSTRNSQNLPSPTFNISNIDKIQDKIQSILGHSKTYYK